MIRLRFGLSVNDQMTLEEVGRLYDVTRERIRQIENRALKHLKHPVRASALIGFIEDRTSLGKLIPNTQSNVPRTNDGQVDLAIAMTQPDIALFNPSDGPDALIHEGLDLAQVLTMALATGCAVDDQRGGVTGAIWVRIPAATSDISRAALGEHFLRLGFKEWPGNGYWK